MRTVSKKTFSSAVRRALRLTPGLIFAAAILPASARQQAPATPDFNRDIRPILSQHCLKCHGPDENNRMAGLRLDISSGALAKLVSGKRAVVAKNAAQSHLLDRIGRKPGDPLLMPPAHVNKPLTETQKTLLKRWIDAGARYETHWAFVAPTQKPLPKIPGANHPIDAFVAVRLQKHGAKLLPQTDRHTLLRRVSLDLVGFPPTPSEIDAFVNDTRPDAYERVVDRLLASPAYGEKWARRWLDLARYADTNGFEKDKPRTLWPWRDWVIRALNSDMPFDTFTIKQLAGDLLANATDDDRIATGFHRNTMINEEGGIDPLEYRFLSMVDRVGVTGTTWLGMTVACAQCHTHKYDPITHKNYYQMLALLNNADEPEFPVWTPELRKRRATAEKEIAEKEASLVESWPLDSGLRPVSSPTKPDSVATNSAATATIQPDGSVFVSGENPNTDTLTITLPLAPGAKLSALQLRALADTRLGNGGPGRTPHGNFVLTKLRARLETPGQTARDLVFSGATADFSQNGFDPNGALDNNPRTGWAISGEGRWNVDRAAVFTLKDRVEVSQQSRLIVTLEQAYGDSHTLGKFSLALVAPPLVEPDPATESVRRRAAVDAALAKFTEDRGKVAVRWTVVAPTSAKSNLPLLVILADKTVRATGDMTKRDLYTLTFQNLPENVTAIRLEALPDDSLPKRGPGRIYYEGPAGDFFLSEMRVASGGKDQPIAKSVATFGDSGGSIDDNPLTGWSVNGAQGRASAAVFALKEPLGGGKATLNLLFERYYAAGLGRFRVSFSTDPRAGKTAMEPALDDALSTETARRTDAQLAAIRLAFVRTTPELAPARARIDTLRKALPEPVSTLVFAERPAQNPRPTFIQKRGEFLQPGANVSGDVLNFLPPLPENAPKNRLAFARWLVSERNPLTARVTVNRQWQAFFGTGIVSTLEDFGYQGALPTDPELLDWLAVQFARPKSAGGLGWSLKSLDRLIVTSKTYRQRTGAQKSSETWLAGFPATRLDADAIRDSALRASGLLSTKLGGPSVFPPQPPGVTTEGTYGPLAWTVSSGDDRYRRGLYTFAKRTAPYALAAAFDAPSGEAICPRRDVTNTPLQALALLNDTVFVEAAQSLGKRIAALPGDYGAKAAALVVRILSRPARDGEIALLTDFATRQKQRIASGELDPATLSGLKKDDPLAVEAAVWTAAARAVFNTDEAIVKR